MLTEREKEVIKLAYLSRNEVAKQLGISLSTVRTHYASAFNKLCVYNRAEALLKALLIGELTIEDFKYVTVE